MRQCLLLLTCLLVFGLPIQAQDTVPRFDETPCPDGLEGYTCGYVIVPENHDDSESRLIRLAVRVHHSLRQTENPPLLYLDGGPGGQTLTEPFFSFLDSSLVSYFGTSRDVILFDQRGIGLSEPSLNCPEIDEWWMSRIDQPKEVEAALSDLLPLAQRCRDRLLESAIDLTAYNTNQNAHDVEAIRSALGYDDVQLYGVSYGTLLAQHVMRLHPEHLAGVVLDSTLPVSVDPGLAVVTNWVNAFDFFFRSCEADSVCNRRFPDLETRFYETVNRLNEDPILLEDVYGVVSAGPYDLLVTGNDLIQLTFGGLYDNFVIQQLPGILSDAADGEYGGFRMLPIVDEVLFLEEGMYLSVGCGDMFAFTDENALTAQIAAVERPELRTFFETALVQELLWQPFCGDWHGYQEAAADNEPVSSEIPTLVLAGEYDPITPVAWGEQVVQTLPNGQLFVFPRAGHGVTFPRDEVGLCARGIALQFIADPTGEIDASCMDDLDEGVFFR